MYMYMLNCHLKLDNWVTLPQHFCNSKWVTIIFVNYHLIIVIVVVVVIVIVVVVVVIVIVVVVVIVIVVVL